MPELFVGDLLITEVSEGIPKCSNIKKLIAQESQELFLFDNWFYFTDILFRKSVSRQGYDGSNSSTVHKLGVKMSSFPSTAVRVGLHQVSKGISNVLFH